MPSGLDLLRAEMARQHADARASLAGNPEVAARAAAAMRETGAALLLGMGASHAVNRVAEAMYREAGIAAQAMPVSEALYAPLPPRPRAVLLTSQSGGSGEVLRYLGTAPGEERRFGLTLDAASPLGRAVPCLIGAGGAERAFAGTRSLTVTLALHAAVAGALGLDTAAADAVLAAPPALDVTQAVAALSKAGCVVFSGRGALQGVAEAAALGVQELARLPALALEGGQFRHGPLELLGPSVGVVLLRAGGPAAALAGKLAAACRAAASPVVVFDASGEAPLGDVLTLRLPPLSGFAAAFAVLPALQALIVGVASARVARVGEPLRSTKVTADE